MLDSKQKNKYRRNLKNNKIYVLYINLDIYNVYKNVKINKKEKWNDV